MPEKGDSFFLQYLEMAYILGAQDQFNNIKYLVSEEKKPLSVLPQHYFLRYKSSEKSKCWRGRSLESLTGRSERFIRKVLSQNSKCGKGLESLKRLAKSKRPKYVTFTSGSKKQKLERSINRVQVSQQPHLKIKQDWETTIRRLRKIVVKGPRWPKQRSVDWETRPALFECLLRTKLLPKKFIASGKLWDHFYCRGSVAKVYVELGLTVRHQNEIFLGRLGKGFRT